MPHGVAAVAAQALQPCIALAGQVLIGSREMRTLGIESAYSTVDLVGEEASFADPAGQPRGAGGAHRPLLVAMTTCRSRPADPS